MQSITALSLAFASLVLSACRSPARPATVPPAPAVLLAPFEAAAGPPAAPGEPVPLDPGLQDIWCIYRIEKLTSPCDKCKAASKDIDVWEAFCLSDCREQPDRSCPTNRTFRIQGTECTFEARRFIQGEFRCAKCPKSTPKWRVVK